MATGQGERGDEGPLAHAARVASDQSYLDGLVDTRRSAWERASGARPQRTPKRLLVSLSHSIEKAVLGGPIGYPTVVVALFQQLRFFDREREVYARMAAAGAIVVVGFVEGDEHQPPDGVHVVSLRPDEPLADEWSVVAVGPAAGAFLVATDQHAFDPSERDHEANREFVGRWGYSRAQAGTELARLRFSLGDRLDVVLRGTIDDLLAEHMPAGGAPAASAGTPGETWATTSLGHMMDGMLTARAGTRELREQLADAQRAVSARAAATTDPHSGVANPDFLRRWSHPTGANPLPIGLALFDVAELDGDAMRDDERASYFAAHQVAAALTQPLGPVDAVVRMSAREFLVVVPGASQRHLAGLCDQISEQLELASHGYPDIALRARVATVVTCRRPLPVDELHGSLTRLDLDGGSGPLDAGEIDGGRVTVSSTALHAGRSGRAASRGPVVEASSDVTPDEAGPEESRDDANGRYSNDPDAVEADPEEAPPVPAPPQPRPAVSPFGHTGSPDAGPAAGGFDPPASRHGGHGTAPDGPVDDAEPAAVAAPDLPQRTAQEALHRLVYGDDPVSTGDPRARMDVFADLSDPPNGHRR
ncbi:DICT sensory domain-containing protein [Pseudonocardia endophytica]|uniref:Diguanylate cyclase/two-component system sensory protein n=1 Tax=Pseudonocardia endophytica TaxID=401976 RepID=A0A4R1HD13_PSEEN|nr:DICT sensory domain-containing protein [Pseudonocardia endophytica]TCK19927.1 diguanylate cyclase/two-component system sensory protein [Pseudonocardia endophytica]